MTYDGRLQYLIEQLVSEEIATITGNYVWGKDRNDGNVNPPEAPQWNGTESEQDIYHHKLQQLEPQINLSSLYRDFLQDVEQTNPEDRSDLFVLYNNFLRTFGLDRDEFQGGKNTDQEAARAVYDYFAKFIVGDEQHADLFNQYGR